MDGGACPVFFVSGTELEMCIAVNLLMAVMQIPVSEESSGLAYLKERYGKMNMENRKINKKIIVSIIVAVILAIVIGGYLFLKQLTNRVLDSETICDQYVETVLTALSEDNLEEVYSLFPQGIDRSKLEDGMAQLAALWAGRQDYQYKKTGFQQNITNGNKTVTCAYLITSGEEQFTLQVKRGENPDGSSFLISFFINPVVDAAVNSQMSGIWLVIQWGLWLLSVLVILATIATAVYCIRHQTGKKWLWAAGILLLYVAGTLTWGPGGGKIGFMVRTPGFSSLVFAADGGVKIAVYVPLGLILFWGCYRKNKGKGQEQVEEEREGETEE